MPKKASFLITIALAVGVGAATPAATAAPSGVAVAQQAARNSPAGGTILLTLNGNLYSVRADGSGLHALTTGGRIGDAAYSPDGTKIAFHKGSFGHRDLYVMRSDGTGVTRLTNTSTWDERYPTWSPDGRTIAFDRMHTTSDRGGIYQMAATPGAPERLIKADYVSQGVWYTFERPDWSPRGDKLAVDYVTWSDHIAYKGRLMRLNGVLDTVGLIGIQNEFNSTGTWVSGFSDDYDANPSGYKQNTTTGASVWLPAGSPDGPPASDLIWSPDSTRLAMRYDANGDGHPDLALMNSSGTGVTGLLYGSSTLSYTPRSWKR